MCDVGLLVTQSHGPDEALVLDRSTREAWTDKSRLSDHPLPALLLRLLSRLDNGEHFLLGNTLDLGQRDREPGSLFITLLLNGRREGFGILLVAAVQEICGKRVGGWLGCFVGFDVAFLVCADLLLHLDLLLPALLGVQLGPQTTEVLRFLRGIVSFTGNLLALALIVIEALSVPVATELVRCSWLLRREALVVHCGVHDGCRRTAS